MEKTFKKNIGSLEAIFAFLDERIVALHIDPESAYAITLAVEEFFSNMVKYNLRSRNDVTIAFDAADGRVTVTLTDTDVDPFDVTGSAGVDLSTAPQEWHPGGLGLHLTKALVDSVDYSYEQSNSIIKFTKLVKR